MNKPTLTEIVEAAKKAIASCGHSTTCSFSACDCGSVEEFKIHSTEFWRLVNNLE